MSSTVYFGGQVSANVANCKDAEKFFWSIEAIHNGWGEPAFAESDDGFCLRYSARDGYEPAEDGLMAPLQEAIETAKIYGVLLTGEFSLEEGDARWFVTVKDNEVSQREDPRLSGATIEDILQELTRRGAAEKVYDMVRKQKVVEDILGHYEDISEEISEEVAELAATIFVEEGQADCNLDYWTNLENVVQRAKERLSMNHYTIHFVDGHDGIYKEFECDARSVEEAGNKLWEKYAQMGDFDHVITSIVEEKKGE